MAQDESLAPGINDRYKQRPEQALEQFHFATRDLSLQKEILEAIGLAPGMDVADVGAGDGTHARLFAEKVLPEGKVYAVEIVPEFLDHIKAICESAQLSQMCQPRGEGPSIQFSHKLLPQKTTPLLVVDENYILHLLHNAHTPHQ